MRKSTESFISHLLVAYKIQRKAKRNCMKNQLGSEKKIKCFNSKIKLIEANDFLQKSIECISIASNCFFYFSDDIMCFAGDKITMA